MRTDLPELDPGIAVHYRRATHSRRCECATPGNDEYVNRSAACATTIERGDLYVEWAEFAADAGDSFCLPCGIDRWSTPS